MNGSECPYEAAVSNAARTGCWDNFSKEHIKQCAHCRETTEIVKWMGSVARIVGKEHLLPDAQHVWLNARIAAMQAARERALRALVIAETAVKVAVILAMAVGIVSSWFGLKSLAEGSLSTYLHAPQSILISATALAACLITMLFTRLAQPMLIED